MGEQMGDTVIGLLHPGEMGAAVAGCLTARGHDVRWASEGRGPATAARAAQAGLADAGTVAALAGQAAIILSVCPPHAALPTARAVAAAGFTGVYVDANAISPATAREVRAVVEAAGGRYVDGGIVGSPPVPALPGDGDGGGPGGTRLYLAGGPAGAEAAGPAAEVAALFGGTSLNPEILRNENPAGASALKMAYAAWTKGSAALVLAARALARAEGVEDGLLAEWALSQPGLEGRSLGAARAAAAKGWRWVGEMDEIAASMTADGLPGGFHQAAAEVFRRSPPDAAQSGGPEAGRPDGALIGAVLAALLAGRA
jgi:3-hydroxyisobutyrate dehydrogenase-like beta-hydroxyacid dehydrogenase